MCDVLWRVGGNAAWASRVLRGVVGSELGDVGSCEGVVNSDLEGSRGDISRVDWFARFLSVVVLGNFHRTIVRSRSCPVGG